ncbi:MAG: hypothetical protein EXS47_02410 [Candidatus Zambryskibacteria bacterium]|nr:hypothetical protein [Candidatus Zambryskibacteria bacterium]
MKIQLIVKRFRMIGKEAYGDWLLVLSVSIVICVVLVVYNVYIYTSVNGGDLFDDSLRTTSGLNTLDRKAIKSTLEMFDIKKVNFESMQKNPPHFDDPTK